MTRLDAENLAFFSRSSSSPSLLRFLVDTSYLEAWKVDSNSSQSRRGDSGELFGPRSELGCV